MSNGINGMVVLKTARLCLRPWRRLDAFDFFKFASQPDVGPNAGWMPHRSIEDSIRCIEDYLLDNPLAWAIELQGRVIGSIGLRMDEKRLNPDAYALGFSMSHDFWGQGIMPEAGWRVIRHGFEDLHAETIACFHYPHNHRSERVIAKLGFQLEGRLRKSAKLGDGSLHDELCYSMTYSEYQAWKGRLGGGGQS